MTPTLPKDPAADLPYGIDWEKWLDDGETIESATWASTPAGLTLHDDAIDAAGFVVMTWISGGAAGTDYTVTVHITTSADKVDERSFKLQCRER